MTKPVMYWGPVIDNTYGTRELFIDDFSLGEYEGWAEDGSVFSVDTVLTYLNSISLIHYEGLE